MKFDEEHWLQTIKRPDWYLELADFNKKAAEALGGEAEEYVNLRRRIRKFFEHQLLADNVKLADHGPNLDTQRESIDMIVIHHAGHPNYMLNYMEATQLLNVYATYYSNPTQAEERGLKGRAIWSNHFRNGKQTFLCYHWLMRMDGSFERLLSDDKLAWHAGNWDINKRSVAICLDNDYEHQNPSDVILQRLAAHIKKHYGFVKSGNIIGHCEARKGTICPGGNFIGGWKNRLLEHRGNL